MCQSWVLQAVTTAYITSNSSPTLSKIRDCFSNYTVPCHAVAAAENNTRVGLSGSMPSAGARAYNGGLGAEPPAGVQGAEPPVGVRGQSPLKLMAF